MKPTITLSALLLVLAMTFSMPSASAHNYYRHHPVWVDVHHCRVETRHLYFPAYNMYYDLERELFIYLSGDTWVFSLALPAMYTHIDLAYEPIVELDFYYDRPFIYNEYHIVHYSDYHRHYGRHDYREYGHHHEYYSYTPKHHYKYNDYDGPRHSEGNYRNSGRHDNGNHYGHYKNGKGNGNNKGNYGRGDNGYSNKGNYGHRNGGSRGYNNNDSNGSGSKGGGTYKRSSVNSKHVTNAPRSTSNGNGRSSNGRSSNSRSTGHRM